MLRFDSLYDSLSTLSNVSLYRVRCAIKERRLLIYVRPHAMTVVQCIDCVLMNRRYEHGTYYPVRINRHSVKHEEILVRNAKTRKLDLSIPLYGDAM